MRDIVNKYKKRFHRNEKNNFLEAVMSAYEELGYTTQRIREESKIFVCVDAICGNIKTAKNVIVVPYDTPKKVLWYNSPMYPQNGDLQMRKGFMSAYIPLFISYGIMLVIVGVIPRVVTLKSTAILNLIAGFYLLFLLYLIIVGIGNSKNATRNNASLILAYDLAKELVKTKKNDVAFIFTDKNASRMKGSLLLSSYFESVHKNPNTIFLYCLGRGDTISIAYGKAMRKNAQTLQKDYKGDKTIVLKSMNEASSSQTPMETFTSGMMISSGSMKFNEIYCDYTATSKDDFIDEEMMEDIKNMLISYFNKK